MSRLRALRGPVCCVALILAPSTGALAEVSEAVIQRSFYPYSDWTPTAPGYEPGLVVDQSNVETFRDILDPLTYEFISKGWTTFRTRPVLSFSLNENYVEATRRNAAGVSLSPRGMLENYVAGRPFPQEPDPEDPTEGLKRMWNFQRGIFGGDAQYTVVWWQFKDLDDGKVERTLKFDFRTLNWEFRTMFDPKPSVGPNPSNIFRSTYLIAYEPFDLANTQVLIHRYVNDLERDDAWIYLGFQRRVRRLATGQTTDAFLGSDLMIEDIEGYNGRLSDYTWEYAGTQNILLSYYIHGNLPAFSKYPEKDPDGWNFVAYGGKGGCFAQLKQQLRKTYKIIGRPRDANHPVGKRVIYQDAETGGIARTIVYDRKGDYWKWFEIGLAHPDHHLPMNDGLGVPMFDAAMFIDVQAGHCTTLLFKNHIEQEGNEPSVFAVQNLRKAGR